MLPPGHIAAGYLVAKVLLQGTNSGLSEVQQTQIIWWTMFFSFAPDLDTFYSFFKEKAFIIKDFKTNNHRKYYSHAPVLWLIAGLLIYFLSTEAYFKYLAFALWLASSSHFLLDIVDGIMWMWPFNKKIYAFKDSELTASISETGFFEYWMQMVKQYSKSHTFYLEILIIVLALIIYFIY